ncbi:MAG: hypothetical protein Q8L74_16290 [Nitrospirota bacterium]|nr:hypothetical protein [Nitrospirota bacterium]MDP2383485.1 hypothetical protein [Nitrospirota bacterium]MDP3598766.1 hypothetical protein [Nitrospirota bacterium]
MVKVCVAGLLPPCWAVKDRLVGLVPIAGTTETAGAEGGAINWASLGISAANLRIVRPPEPPGPELPELAVLAAASGTDPVDAVLAAKDPVVGDGAVLMAARGRVDPTLLLRDEGSLG